MGFESWDELRTAWHVVRAGTVSGAADALGVHHATVIRHIDALEARLNLKLFQRHPRGYTPTEAGELLAQVGRATEEQFAQLAARLTGLGPEVSGDLVITTLPEACDLILPALSRLQIAHPGLRLRLITERRVLRLEYGEAHIAIRAGSRPDEPDNVVQELTALAPGLYGATSYLERHGHPACAADLADHLFVGEDTAESRAPFMAWLRGAIDQPQFVFRSNEALARHAAVVAGLGLGFLFPSQTKGLVEVMAPQAEWTVPLWLVTHVDLHRTSKVQAAVAALKQEFRG
jgi:DNA-binding transcriptional LysR family regulator